MSNDPVYEYGDYRVSGLKRINILLGRNGCGKSTVLKRMQEMTESGSGVWATSRYITPERGGTLVFDANVENTIRTQPGWMGSSRRVNQLPNFKQQTLAQYQQLEISVLRRLERSQQEGACATESFDSYIDSINSVLENVKIARVDNEPAFRILSRDGSAFLSADQISSGESELIALSIESLVFPEMVSNGRGLLLLDEPDVHLHPDMQMRFMSLLGDIVQRSQIDVVIATHSTPILGGAARFPDTTVCMMQANALELVFKPIEETYRHVLPVFGAHPLSQIFNKSRLVLVEGSDDVRIWQQAVRSSQGKIDLYPVECGGKPKMYQYELSAIEIIRAVYDQGCGYSLRDRDDTPTYIEDMGPLIRLRLTCRAAENLLLADETLARCGLTWSSVQEKIEKWLGTNQDHSKYSAMKKFAGNGFDRRGADLKEIRLVLVGQIIESSKPWEVIVGATIGEVMPVPDSSETSLASFLGDDVVRNLLNSEN